MCGILGFFGADLGAYSKGVLEECADIIRHRGPDFSGYYRSAYFWGASLRLSILDLENGNQPIETIDQRYVIVFNGEIINYRELRAELIQRGVQFKTKTDTEVILYLYVYDREAMFEKLEGQFSFLIFDREKQELFGGRDRWGICPFFFAQLQDGNYVIASEIKAFFGIPGFNFELNPLGIQQISWCWSNVAPVTAWKGIAELPIGHYIRFSLGKEPEIRRYYNIASATKQLPFGTIREAIYGVKDLLVSEIKKHMVADVPVGSYLSGGIDSSVLVAVASQLCEERLHTFSISFEEEEFDESIAQQELVHSLQLNHTKVRIANSDIARNFPAAVFHAEKPFFRTAPVPLFILSQKVNEMGFKVVLTGEGSDEVFWGYDTYRELIIRKLWANNPNSEWRPRLFSKIFSYFPQYQDKRNFEFLKLFYKKTLGNTEHPLYPMFPRFENGWAVNQLLLREKQAEKNDLEAMLIQALPHGEELSALKRCQTLELQTLLPGYLLSSQGDRMLAAHSVEGRFPFLGLPLVETLWNVPDRWKIHGFVDKYLLREAFRGEIPESIRTRPKFAYRAPDVKAFFPNPPPYVEYLLSNEYISKVGLFSPVAVANLLKKLKNHKEGQAVSMKDNVSFVWLLSTHLLHYCYVERNSWSSLI